jgi:hypothetical protein
VVGDAAPGGAGAPGRGGAPRALMITLRRWKLIAC